MKTKNENPVWIWACANCKNTTFTSEPDMEMLTYVDVCQQCGQRYAWSKEMRGD